MKFLKLIGTLAIFFVAVAPVAHGAVVVVDFDTAADEPLTGGETYSEDGMTMTQVSSSSYVYSNYHLQSFTSVGEVWSFEKDDGGLFSFVSFDLLSIAQGSLTDAFDVVGLVGGSQVVNYGNYVTSSGTYVTFYTNNSILVDEVQFIGTQVNNASAHLDNYVFDAAVPAPAAIGLLGLGLAGLGFTKRRRKA